MSLITLLWQPTVYETIYNYVHKQVQFW